MSTIPHSLEAVHFSPQTIYCGDCLDILGQFPAGEVDLIYIDPPFNSSRNYEVFWGDTQEKRAFDDRFGDAMAYIEYMRPRVEQLHRMLKPTGSFYFHCDWHASHYIKVMLDEIFGANQFVNEIVWVRSTAHNDPKRYGNVSDTIFYYAKGKQRLWNPQFQPMRQTHIEASYRKVDADGRRYMEADLTANKPGGDVSYEWKGVKPYKGRYWAYSKENLERFEAEGRLIYRRTGMPRLKVYLDEQEGVPVQNVWDDIRMSKGERLGYPTQKPLALLERIIKASSNPGDIVLDAFCGCGTTLVAAQQLGRRWVGIDVSPSAVRVMGQRLEDICGMVPAPPTLSASEVAASWDGGMGAPARQPSSERSEPARADRSQREMKDSIAGDGNDGRGRPSHQYYRFSNLPRSPEQLRRLPGFEFENWAVLQLGEVLKQQDSKISARVNRSKVGDMGIDGRIYLADKVSLPKSSGDLPLEARMGGSGERRKYLPIQVKNTDKVGRPEIDKFAHALRRDERSGGFFIGWEFSRDAEKEIERVERDDGLTIVPVRVESLIAEDFKTVLIALLRG